MRCAMSITQLVAYQPCRYIYIPAICEHCVIALIISLYKSGSKAGLDMQLKFSQIFPLD